MISTKTLSAPKSSVFNVLIVGAGNIAGRLDEVRHAQYPITHAGAFKSHNGFFVLGCVEPNLVRLSEFQSYWGIPHGFSCLNEALSCDDVYHLAVICSPTFMHHEHLKALHKSPVSMVFAEKPLTDNILTARFICDLYRNGKPKLAVNFNRRWNLTIAELAKDIAKERYGELISSYGIYTKGILNNGTHLLDLFDFLLGPLEAIRVTRWVNDWSNSDDPTLDAELRTRNGAPIYLIGGDSRCFFMFELTLIFEQAVISIENGGSHMRVRPVGRCNIGLEDNSIAQGKIFKTLHEEQFILAVNNLYNALSHNEPLLSTAVNALRAQELASTLIDYQKGNL